MADKLFSKRLISRALSRGKGEYVITEDDGSLDRLDVIVRLLPIRVDADLQFVNFSHDCEVRGSLWKVLFFDPPRSCARSISTNYIVNLQRVTGFFSSFVEDWDNRESQSKENYLRIIQNDIHRTFPRHVLFQQGGIGIRMLSCVLQAYMAYDIDVGYCQGMNFIAGYLLLHYKPKDAFCCLVSMFNDTRFLLREIFLPGFPLVLTLNRLFQRLMKKYLSKSILQKFRTLGLDSGVLDSIMTQWWMTLFVNALSIQYTTRMWDNFLLFGWKGIFACLFGLVNAQTHKIDRLCSLESLKQFLLHNLSSHLPNGETFAIPSVFLGEDEEFGL